MRSRLIMRDIDELGVSKLDVLCKRKYMFFRRHWYYHLADVLLKFKMLLLYGFGSDLIYGFNLRKNWFQQWVLDVWVRDGSSRMCCDGRECGCQGVDYHEWWIHQWVSWPNRSKIFRTLQVILCLALWAAMI